MGMDAQGFKNIPERFRKYFKLSTTEDADYVAEHMSQASRAELDLAVNQTPQEACYKGIALSSLCVTIIDPDSGQVFGMGGVGGGSNIWLLLCDGALENKNIRRLLIREAKPFLHWVLNKSGLVDDFMENYTSPSDSKQLRWLEWLGADLIPYDMGDDVKLMMFTFTKNIK